MKEFKLISLAAILLSFLTLTACSDDGGKSTGDEPEGPFTIESLSGVIQKGPFNSGGNITLLELDAENLSQTGRSFNSQIKNNLGEFEFGSIELEGRYANLRADGFYFNEISGENSGAQLTLHALADVAEDSVININVITHLAKSRIEYLVSQGMEFEEAEQQAVAEIWSVFGMAETVEANSAKANKLNLTAEGTQNVVLIAISSILQGYRTEAELSELLSLMADDLREDGTLDNESLGSQLINHSIYLKPDEIRQNLIDKYNDLGLEVDIPDFSEIIELFNEFAPYEITERLIDYPAEGQYGTNVLNPDSSEFVTYRGNTYFNSLAADLVEGTSLRIKISTLAGSPVATEGMWFYDVFSGVNLEVKSYDYDNHTQEFVAIEPGKPIDLKIHFDPGTFLVEYFEMDAEAEEPTWSREFRVKYK